jgi:hypothetical protein
MGGDGSLDPKEKSGTSQSGTCREWRSFARWEEARGGRLLAAVRFVVVAYGVNVAERDLGGGALGCRGLIAMGRRSATNFGGTAVVEVLEAAGGGEVGSGTPI